MATLHELKELKDASSGEARSVIAGKVAAEFASGVFTLAEKQVAVEIFRLLVGDAEARVRQMLSHHLMHCLDAPHDVILRLAQDTPIVSLPLLEHSYVLSEDDLIAITKSTHDVLVLSAIARRESVSEELSDALLGTTEQGVIETLLGNKSASIHPGAIERLLTRHHDMPSVLELLVKRGNLPITLAEKLFVLVSEEMKRALSEQYHLSLQLADDVVLQARELAILGLMDQTLHAHDIGCLVAQLYDKGRLNISVILRSLCLGDMRFFEHTMAKLAGIPLCNAQLLLLDPGIYGVEALYKSTGLPPELMQATLYLFKIALEETMLGQYHRHDFMQCLASRLMQENAASKVEYLDYVLTLIHHTSRHELSPVA